MFQVTKESDFGKIGHVIVVREDGENRDPFFGTGIDEGFSVVVLAHEIDQAKPLTPERLLIVIGAFAQDLLDVVGNLGGLRAARSGCRRE